MNSKPMTFKEWKRLKSSTKAQHDQADRIGAVGFMLSQFGNLRCWTQEALYIIARDGKVTFQTKRDRRLL